MSNLNRNNLALAACVICPGLILGAFLTFPIWVPAWISEFGTSRGSVMLIYSASGVLMTLTMPIVGRLLIRIPAWRLVAVGAVMVGGGMLLASLVRSYPGFATLYALAIGPGVALASIVPCQSLAARLAPRRLGMIAGLMMVALAAAGIVLPILLTRLEAMLGWRTTFALTGAGVMILTLLLAVGLMRNVAGMEPAAASAHQSGKASVTPLSTVQILGTGAFWLIVAALLPLLVASLAAQTNFLPILADHGVGQHAAGFVLSGMGVGTAIGAPLFGWLADRINPRLLILAEAVVMACALLALAAGAGLPVAIAAAVALGIASGGTFPLTSIFAFQQFGASYALAFGLLQSAMLPYLFAPPLLGWIRDHTGSYSPALLIWAPVLVLCATATWWLRSPVTTRRTMNLHAPAPT